MSNVFYLHKKMIKDLVTRSFISLVLPFRLLTDNAADVGLDKAYDDK